MVKATEARVVGDPGTIGLCLAYAQFLGSLDVATVPCHRTGSIAQYAVAGVSQLAEGAALKAVQCGFESRLRHGTWHREVSGMSGKRR